jgi:pimeloyl-ACP methyl ester carboxylesterase
MTRFAVLLIACSCASRVPPSVRADALVDVGQLGAAAFRIDVPRSWNGGLVLLCHGYRGGPVAFDPKAPDELAAMYGALGYAVAQSGYSEGGYAIAQAIDETEALREHFVRTHGAPKATFLHGVSMGSFAVMALLERHPDRYSGALATCAALGPPVESTKALVFDLLVLTEAMLPGLLPSPGQMPRDFMTTVEGTERARVALEANPRASQVLRRYSHSRDNDELSKNIDLFAYILTEMQRRFGGNPFDNQGTIYVGDGDELELNRLVKRYAADPGAQARANSVGAITGHLERPLISFRNVFDPLLGAYPTDRYAEMVRAQGAGRWFVQQAAPREGHCNFTPTEQRQVFERLVRWAEGGPAPTAGVLSGE